MIGSASSLWSRARITVLLAAGVCALAPAALAQPAPATPASSAAPANGQTLTPAVLNKGSRDYVQAYTARSGKIDQVPRWHQPVCVSVTGLTPGEAAKVAARIEQVAKGVGLKAPRPGCQSNVQVVFTDTPQDMANRIGVAYVGYHQPTDLKKLRTVIHPIQGWYATATTGDTNSAGLLFSSGATNATPGMESRGPAQAEAAPAWDDSVGRTSGSRLTLAAVDTPDSETPTGCANSRFSSCLTSVFMNVLLVADTHAIQGKGLGAVADYLSLLALAQPRSLDGCGDLPSVIDLLAKAACPGRATPAELTPADSAYLTALYTTDPEARTGAAQTDIAGRMAKILIKAQAVAR